MREIKFDIVLKHKNDNDIIHEIFDYAEIFNGIAKEKISYLNEDGYIVIEKRQFTGLKDKNGVDIYEGDVVNFRANYTNKPAGYMNGVIKITPYELLLVVGNIEYNALEETDEFPYAKCEIIGNIYENPELL